MGKESERIRWIDACKAVCILLVVLLHSGLETVQRFSIFMMPAFFALSGFVYSPDKRSRGAFIRERFRRLVLPFWGLNVLYAAVEAVRSAVLGYGGLRNLLTFPVYMAYGSSILAPATGLTGLVSGIAYPYPMAFGRTYIVSPSANHLWFLPAMFSGSVLFCLLEKITRKGPLPKLLAVTGLLGLACFESAADAVRQLPWGLGTGSFGAACMLCGQWAKRYRLTEKGRAFAWWTALAGLVPAVLAECLGSTGVALISSYYGPHGIWSVLLTFAGGLGGAWTLACLMKALDTPRGTLVRVLSPAGRASMRVYEYHMVFLFLLGYAFLAVSGTEPQLDGWLLGFLPVNAGTAVFLIAESLVITGLLTWADVRLKKRKRPTAG